MTEILTESFCERCGTRYTFESARPRVRLKGVRVLSRGLKNFVLSDDNSIDEAMAAARSDTDRELTAHQLDAFHKTFNFCMSCRQYTCPNCWNEAEARCLTCAPNLGQEVMPAPFPDLVTSSYLVADPVESPLSNGSNGHEAVEDTSTPGVDTSDFAARLQALMAPPDLEKPAETVAAAKVADEVLEAVVEPPVEAPAEFDEPMVGAAPAEVAAEVDEPAEPVAGFEAGEIEDLTTDDEPVVADIAIAAAAGGAENDESDEAAEIAARLAAWGAAAAAFDATHDDEPDSPRGTAPTGAAQTGGLLRRFRAGQNLDAELDAYERDQTETPVADHAAVEAVAAAALLADEPEGEPEAVAAIEPEIEVETIAAVEPETVVAAEPETFAAAEPEFLEPEVLAAAEPEVLVAAEPEPVAAAEPEALAALEPEALAAPEPEVAAAQAETPTEPEPIPATEPVDVVQQPTWSMVAPDPTIDVPATPPISPAIPAAATAPDANAEPQWPARAGAEPSVGLPFLNRPPAATGGLEALWAESARDVVAPPTVAGRPVATGGVQPCVSCGLSLSATARFCRRCGTHQTV